MNYILLAVSVMSQVLRNCIYNTVGKKASKNTVFVFQFNSVMYILCTVVFAMLAITNPLSWFTIALGIGYGILTVLTDVYTIKALSSGPMYLTVLITTSSMLIPTIFGMMLANETPSILKIVSILLLIGFIYLSGEKDTDGVVSKKWIFNCSVCFVTAGMIGVLQKLHQLSEWKGELNGFLATAFVSALICAVIVTKKNAKETSEKMVFTRKHYVIALLCGVCVFAMNLINLKLSGLIPSQIFFPLVNGGSIILSSVSSILIFKEKLAMRQIIGLCGGIVSLILICVL